MKTIIIVLLLLSNCGFSQTGVLPYENGRVIYLDTMNVSDNFIKTVKIGLGNYASHYNTSVVYLQNKMSDYIIYEDSTTIVANFKFLTNQLMNEALWDARATFTKQGETILCKVDNIHLHDIVISGLGQQLSDASIEGADKKTNKKMMMLVDQKIKIFYKLVSE